MIPADWRTWTEQERKAVLAHEMAHIVNNDYLAVLISQVGLSLHFYHPLVHWMSAQLRLEQEFAADAIAANHAGGRREYLKTLAFMALRKSNESQIYLERAFLPESGMLMKRISMLRERRRPTRPLSLRSQSLLVAAILAAGLAVSGLRQPSNAAIWATPMIATPTLTNVSAEPRPIQFQGPALDEKNSSKSRPAAKICRPLTNGDCRPLRSDSLRSDSLRSDSTTDQRQNSREQFRDAENEFAAPLVSVTSPSRGETVLRRTVSSQHISKQQVSEQQVSKRRSPTDTSSSESKIPTSRKSGT